MPPIPNPKLLHAPRMCATCGSGTVYYDVVHLKFENSGRIKLCEECFEGLVNDKTPQQCGLCTQGAEYGTWRLERYDTGMAVDPQAQKYVPDYWLFCENHFQELVEKVESWPRQTRIIEFQEGIGYLDLDDVLLPMSRDHED